MASQVNKPIIATIVARHRSEPTVAERMDAAINPHSTVARNSMTSCLGSIGSRPLGSYNSSPTGPALSFAVQAAFCSFVWCIMSPPGKKYRPGCWRLLLSAAMTASSSFSLIMLQPSMPVTGFMWAIALQMKATRPPRIPANTTFFIFSPQ